MDQYLNLCSDFIRNGEFMKKIYTIIVFLLLSVFSFANFNDNLNLLKEEDQKLVEEKITELGDNKNITVFVNTLSADEGFAISDPEHAVILNLKKIENSKKFSVELSFSKDIDIDDYREDIDEVLASTEEILKQGEYTKYLIATLDGVGTVLDNIEIEPLSQMTMTKEQEESGNNLYLLAAIGILITLGVSFVLFRLEKLDEKNNQ